MKTDLLESLKELVRIYSEMLDGIEPDEGLGWLEDADATIARAEGRDTP